jgi:hypothetical protein
VLGDPVNFVDVDGLASTKLQKLLQAASVVVSMIIGGGEDGKNKRPSGPTREQTEVTERIRDESKRKKKGFKQKGSANTDSIPLPWYLLPTETGGCVDGICEDMIYDEVLETDNYCPVY